MAGPRQRATKDWIRSLGVVVLFTGVHGGALARTQCMHEFGRLFAYALPREPIAADLLQCRTKRENVRFEAFDVPS